MEGGKGCGGQPRCVDEQGLAREVSENTGERVYRCESGDGWTSWVDGQGWSADLLEPGESSSCEAWCIESVAATGGTCEGLTADGATQVGGSCTCTTEPGDE